MAEVKNVVIGIQARSTSERFPRKIFETIEGKPLVQWVIDSAKNSMGYLNRWAFKHQMIVNVVLLVPDNDEAGEVFQKHVKVFYGPEQDVLKRYSLMANHMRADYVVRLTSDCPLIPGQLISFHIQRAHTNEYDYYSNVDERYRTCPDGWDCEVLSRRALDWLDENAKDAYDREHVTPLLRKSPPDWAKMGGLVGFVDLSSLKISVDTPEDLERVRYEAHRIKKSLNQAEELYGKEGIHRCF